LILQPDHVAMVTTFPAMYFPALLAILHISLCMSIKWLAQIKSTHDGRWSWSFTGCLLFKFHCM